MVIWLTGLSGSGKTTIGRAVCALWKAQAPNTVLVDGDIVRRLTRFDDEGIDAYTLAGRRANAERIADLCAWLDDQGINVVCSTISLYPDLHERNRTTLSRYFEVYLSVPMEVLRRRDDKQLYSRALSGEIKNVVGVDQKFDPPISPDLVIHNDADRDDVTPLAREILTRALAS